jgi:hypothetical protein
MAAATAWPDGGDWLVVMNARMTTTTQALVECGAEMGGAMGWLVALCCAMTHLEPMWVRPYFVSSIVES